MNKTLIASIAAAAGLAVSGISLAGAPNMHAPAANNWYIGIGLNYNSILKDRHVFGEECNCGFAFELKKHDLGLNFIGGKYLTNRTSTEIGVNFIGDTTWKTDHDPQDEYYSFKAKDIFHIYWDGLFFMHVTKDVDVYAKGGVSYVEAKNQLKEYEWNDDYYHSSNISHATFRGFGLNYGAGAQYKWDRATLRAEYLRFVPNHDTDLVHVFTDTVNVDFLWDLA